MLNINSQEVWLKFENSIKEQGKQQKVIEYTALANVAEVSGIYDSNEVLQAVRFLHDLGSLQYFENLALKDKVVIDPQVIEQKEKPLLLFLNINIKTLSGLWMLWLVLCL